MGDQGTLRLMRTAGGLTHRNALRKKITDIRVTRLVFVDDHKMLKDIDPESKDWCSGGSLYVAKQGRAHWLSSSVSFPVSVTKGTRLALDVELAVSSEDADPVDCLITATPSLKAGDSGAPEAFTFEARAVLPRTPGLPIRLDAKAALADHVFAAVGWTLSWKVEAAGRTFDAGTTGPHQLYVTYGTPEPGGKPLKNPYHEETIPFEDGITHKRMAAAVALTEDRWRQGIKVPHPETKELMDRDDPHHIVVMLNTWVTQYSIGKSEKVPKEYNHPSYINAGDGMARCGAWPIIDYPMELAECQAIVRFIRGVIMQIGCPGELKLVAVYAAPDAGGGRTALVDYLIPRDQEKEKYRYSPELQVWSLSAGTTRASRTQVVNGEQRTQQLFLVSRPDDGQPPVAVGDVVPKGSLLNNFEACIQFTHGGQTRYYAGGVPGSVWKTPQEVLSVFQCLVWASAMAAEPGNETADTPKERWRIDEIVASYEDE